MFLKRIFKVVVGAVCVQDPRDGFGGHSSPKKITALPSNRTVNTSIELVNTSIELINTSIETHAALAFSFMHALNIMFTSPQAIAQLLAIML